MLDIKAEEAGVRLVERIHVGRLAMVLILLVGLAALYGFVLAFPWIINDPEGLDPAGYLFWLLIVLGFMALLWRNRASIIDEPLGVEIAIDPVNRLVTQRSRSFAGLKIRSIPFADIADATYLEAQDHGEGWTEAPRAVMVLTSGEQIPLQVSAPDGDRAAKRGQQQDATAKVLTTVRAALGLPLAS